MSSADPNRPQRPHRPPRPSCAEALEPRRLLDAAPGEVIQTFTHPANGHTYHLLAPTGWDDAEAKSIALGGHLVVVNDQAEQDYLWSTFGPLSGLFWIGFTDADHEGRYVWTTGEPSTYTNWFAGEPNNLYPSGERWGNMWIDYGGKWNDLGPDSDQGTIHYGVAEVRNGPDVFATLAGGPGALEPGASFGVSGTLKNLGAVATSASVRVAYYLSSDAALDAGDRLISGGATAGGGLPFNGSVPISSTLTVPGDVQPGTYYVLAQVDADGALAESDEANNIAVSEAFDVGAVMEPVRRTVRGVVRDANDLPLHGVEVRAEDQLTYSDYDGARSKLDRDGVTGDFELRDVLVGHNVTFGGVFGRFVADRDAVISAFASDLAGASYTNAREIDEILTLDAAQPDGGLPEGTPVDLRPIFLTNYTAVAPDGVTLRLHRDLRNDRYSDRITTKPHRSVAASGRYRKGVEVVIARLAALGFRENADAPLASVPLVKRKSSAETALKLFKDIVLPSTGSRRSKTAATVDEATLAALNAIAPAAGLLWTNVLPPKWSAAPGLADGYVNRATFEAMRRLAEAAPVAGFVLTRGSPPDGGAGRSRRIGNEIEFRWIDSAGTSQTGGSFWEPMDGFTRRQVKLLGGRRVGVPDPGQLGVRWRYVPSYDPAATEQAIRALLDAGVTRVRFNDPAVLQNLGAIAVVVGRKSVVKIFRDDVGPGAGYDAVISATI